MRRASGSATAGLAKSSQAPEGFKQQGREEHSREAVQGFPAGTLPGGLHSPPVETKQTGL